MQRVVGQINVLQTTAVEQIIGIKYFDVIVLQHKLDCVPRQMLRHNFQLFIFAVDYDAIVEVETAGAGRRTFILHI